jgi:hypothetical protein
LVIVEQDITGNPAAQQKAWRAKLTGAEIGLVGVGSVSIVDPGADKDSG